MKPDDRTNHLCWLLGAIARIASDHGSRLTKVRLVKFIYIYDLFSAHHTQRTYTSWQWAFVHYGPYCRASTDIIDLAVKQRYLSAQAYESNYSDEDYRLYGPGVRISDSAFDELISKIPIYISSRLFSTV